MKIILLFCMLVFSSFGIELKDIIFMHKAGYYKKAIKLLEDICNDSENINSALGCGILGEFYFNGDGVQRDTVKAIEYFKLSCDKKSKDACFNLGVFYAKGDVVAKDTIKAAKYFDLGCNYTHYGSCVNLGLLYGKGDGVKKDMQKALGYFELGCDNGVDWGCHNLGAYYGNSVDSLIRAGSRELARLNFKKATKYYKEGCDLGLKKSCDMFNVFKRPIKF